MAAIETTASDIETAIAQGLAKLNLIRAEVKIEVLEDGSRGVLGIGAKPARVRLTPFVEFEAAASVATSQDDDDDELDSAEESINPDDDLDADEEADGVDDADEANEADEAEMEIEGAPLAASLTQTTLDHMGMVTATCISRSVLPQDDNDQPVIWVDIDFEPNEEGDQDADALLAYQQEALNALQMMVQTMWSHQTKSSVRVTLDVNGFKERKQSQVKQMALRMAERVIASGRAMTLEPMPASERRLVHMALRDHPDVFTESAGEGQGRKVTIKPKK
jgi:spoIIIJ-associated protein